MKNFSRILIILVIGPILAGCNHKNDNLNMEPSFQIVDFSDIGIEHASVVGLKVSTADLESENLSSSTFPNLKLLILYSPEWVIVPPTIETVESRESSGIEWGFLDRVPTIETLVISNIPLKQVPAELEKLPGLKHLAIGLQYPDNISKVIHQFESLKKLEMVDLEGSLFQNDQEDQIVRSLPRIEISRTSFKDSF